VDAGSSSPRSSPVSSTRTTSRRSQEQGQTVSDPDLAPVAETPPPAPDALASSADLPSSLVVPLLPAAPPPPELDWLAKVIRVAVMLYAIYRVAQLLRPVKRQEA
jgi:hypothetical protein